MSANEGRPAEVQPRPGVDADHLTKGTSKAEATTLLVAHVQGHDRPRAMALSPDAVMRLLTQHRGRVITLAAADDLAGATAAVQAIRATVAHQPPAPWTTQVHRGATAQAPHPPMDQE